MMAAQRDMLPRSLQYAIRDAMGESPWDRKRNSTPDFFRVIPIKGRSDGTYLLVRGSSRAAGWDNRIVLTQCLPADTPKPRTACAHEMAGLRRRTEWRQAPRQPGEGNRKDEVSRQQPAEFGGFPA